MQLRLNVINYFEGSRGGVLRSLGVTETARPERVTYLAYSKHTFCTYKNIAGWSSLAARVAHNHQVAGSNPAPATSSFHY